MMVVYHLPTKSGNFAWIVNGKSNFVSPNGIFLGKTGFLERKTKIPKRNFQILLVFTGSRSFDLDRLWFYLSGKSCGNGTSASPWKFPFGIWRVPMTTTVDQSISIVWNFRFRKSWAWASFKFLDLSRSYTRILPSARYNVHHSWLRKPAYFSTHSFLGYMNLIFKRILSRLEQPLRKAIRPQANISKKLRIN